MKIDGRAMALFNIKKEVYLVALCKLVAFWCSLFFIYNFVDLLFYLLDNHSKSGFILTFAFRTTLSLVIYYLATTGDNFFSHKIYNKVEKLSLNYTEAVNTGSLLVMNSSSIVNIEFYFNKFVPQMFATLFIVLSSFIVYGKIHILLFITMLVLYPLIPISIMVIIKMIIYVDLRLTVLAFVPMILVAIGCYFFGVQMKKRQTARQEAFSFLSDKVQESISGIRVLKAFVQEKKDLEEFQKAKENNMEKNLYDLNKYSSDWEKNIVDAYKNKVDLEKFHSVDDEITYESHKK